MTARDEELAGARVTAALKALARKEKLKRAEQLATEGFSTKQIAERLGMGRETVAGWLKRKGVAFVKKAGSGPLALLW